MLNTEKLSHEEKVFLAGCIKTMILADGNITSDELSEIDEMYSKEGFDDFDACLKEYEDTIKSNDDFWNCAKKITSAKSQEIILLALDEIALEGGFADPAEKKFYNKLAIFWEENK